MYDQTDAEIARREHDAEMGGESAGDRRWSKWVREVETALIDAGITDANKGLDGNEYTGGGDADEGFSLDTANKWFDRGQPVVTYVNHVRYRRAQLGL